MYNGNYVNHIFYNTKRVRKLNTFVKLFKIITKKNLKFEKYYIRRVPLPLKCAVAYF